MNDLLQLLKTGRLPLFSKSWRRGYQRLNIAGFCETHKEFVRGVEFKIGEDMNEVQRFANSEHRRGCPTCESASRLPTQEVEG